MKPFANDQYSRRELFCIGIDLIEVSRFSQFDFKSRLAKNIFTERELQDCKDKENAVASLAARFAAKEAVKKCLRKNIKCNLIEITNKKYGQPEVNLLDKKLKEKYSFLLSLTHTESFAQAVCISFVEHE